MLPNIKGVRLLRTLLICIALAAAGLFLLRSYRVKPVTVSAAEQGFEAAELERQAAAARAEVVVAHAEETRAATKPVVARAESLRTRVLVAGSGQLRVRKSGSIEGTLVPVPPLVTERIQADSAAIGALSLALTQDARAVAAEEEQLVTEAKARDAARLTITQLEREHSPRCGRRCGMLLGAASVVALGIAVDQTHRLFHY